MYTPAHFTASEDDIQSLLRNPGAANLVTPTATGLQVTMLPLTFRPEIGEHGSLLGHVARNNPHWQRQPTGESVALLMGPDSYVSPTWYAAKVETHRVVPTWNYLTAHVYGELIVHDDPKWLAEQVGNLTDLHEIGRSHPWAVTDAPDEYIDGQLKAIVGLELRITRIEAKAKLSQNRPDADVPGILAGLAADGQQEMATQVAEHRK